MGQDTYLSLLDWYVVEEASEIDPRWFDGAASVGICGATSTPKWLMQEVADAIGNFNEK